MPELNDCIFNKIYLCTVHKQAHALCYFLFTKSVNTLESYGCFVNDNEVNKLSKYFSHRTLMAINTELIEHGFVIIKSTTLAKSTLAQ